MFSQNHFGPYRLKKSDLKKSYPFTAISYPFSAMLSVYSNLPKYRQLSYFELNQPKWKLETSNNWMNCFLDMYISHIMCLRKQKKLFSSADTANKIHHLKSPLMLSVYHNLLYTNIDVHVGTPFSHQSAVRVTHRTLRRQVGERNHGVLQKRCRGKRAFQ